jgi:integrase
MKKPPEFVGINAGIVDSYVRHCKLNGKKEKTILGEQWQLLAFTRFINNKSLGTVKKEDIEDFILCRKETCSPVTVHNNFIVLRNFFTWYKPKNKFFTEIKSRQPKNNLPVEALLLPEDVLQLRDVAQSQRERALVMLLWDSATRKGELLGINLGHFQPDKYGATVIVRGKTGERRIRLIDCVPDIQLWINMHPDRNNPESPLFITERKYENGYRRLDEQTVNNILNSLAEKAGIKKNVYPHAFRHGKLTDLSKHGLNEMELRIFAGWTKESQMPATYLHLSGADVERKILAANGIVENDLEKSTCSLQPITCPRCKEANPAGTQICNKCGMILDPKLAAETEAKDRTEKEELKTQIQDVKNVSAKLEALQADFDKMNRIYEEMFWATEPDPELTELLKRHMKKKSRLVLLPNDGSGDEIDEDEKKALEREFKEKGYVA